MNQANAFSTGIPFVGRTQSEEGLLQISFHLLLDALLDVVGTVALISLKHFEETKLFLPSVFRK